MRDSTFADFKNILEERFSTGAFAIFYDVGKGCGVRSCERLMQEHSSTSGLLEGIVQRKREERWGELRFELSPDGTGKVFMTDCFEARQYGASKQPICYFFKGYLEGFLSRAFRRPLKVTETECLAKGDKGCIFQINAES